MKKLLLVVLIITNITTLSFALSNDIKFDMYKNTFVEQIEAKKYDKALFTLKKLKKLGKPIPSSLLYFEGKAYSKTGKLGKAYKPLEQYVSKEGKKAKYYKEALSLLFYAEEAMQKEQDSQRSIQQQVKEHNENLQGEVKHKGLIYGLIKSPLTNRIWLDRNLGASRACVSPYDKACFGDYYQWGRGTDGHEKPNSKTTKIPSLVANPTHGKFVIYSKDNKNWITPLDTTMWKGVNAINNPCPTGFKVPSKKELKPETRYISNQKDAFNSFLKLAAAGNRLGGDGYVNIQGHGDLWTDTYISKKDEPTNFLYSKKLTRFKTSYTVSGFPVRCIKH